VYRYFVSQSSEFCRHNPLRRFSRVFIVVVCFVVNSVWKLLDTPSFIVDNVRHHGGRGGGNFNRLGTKFTLVLIVFVKLDKV
jgi:hypothetical protein